MAEKVMPLISDPAKDIAELCQKLNSKATERGETFLASKFKVDVSSSEFYQLIFCINERFDFLIGTLQTLDIDQDQIDSAINDLSMMRNAFQSGALVNPWHNNSAGGLQYVQELYTKPIKALSPIVRAKISYPQLSGDEVTEVLGTLEDLEGWLNAHQLKEQDFIRQSIIDGLKKFRFCLEHLEWVGWGYTLNGLREVVGAYLALERSDVSSTDPNAKALLKKVAAAINAFYTKAHFAKDAWETVDFVLKTYGAVSMFLDAPIIAGLLSKLD